MDEIVTWHRGKVDEWRVLRVNAYTIAMSSGNYGKSPPRMEELISLPYDEERTETLDDDWITTFYNNATK